MFDRSVRRIRCGDQWWQSRKKKLIGSVYNTMKLIYVCQLLSIQSWIKQARCTPGRFSTGGRGSTTMRPRAKCDGDKAAFNLSPTDLSFRPRRTQWSDKTTRRLRSCRCTDSKTPSCSRRLWFTMSHGSRTWDQGASRESQPAAALSYACITYAIRHFLLLSYALGQLFLNIIITSILTRATHGLLSWGPVS